MYPLCIHMIAEFAVAVNPFLDYSLRSICNCCFQVPGAKCQRSRHRCGRKYAVKCRPGANSERAKPARCGQSAPQSRPLQREKFGPAPGYRTTDRRDRNKCRAHGNISHGIVRAVSLENSEPVPAQQLFEGFFEIEPDCVHEVCSRGQVVANGGNSNCRVLSKDDCPVTEM